MWVSIIVERLFSSCCSKDFVSNFVIAVLGKLEPDHYSDSHFQFVVVVIVIQFFDKILYIVKNNIGEKSSSHSKLRSCCCRIFSSLSRRKTRDGIYTHWENKNYLSQLAWGQSGVGVVQGPAAKTTAAVPAVRRTAVKAARVNRLVWVALVIDFLPVNLESKSFFWKL